MIGVLVVIVVGIGFLVLTSQNNKTPNLVTNLETQTSPTAVVENTQTPNSSDWNIYTNKTYNFSIKYPKTYEIQPGNEEQNTCIRLNVDSPCEVLINIYPNKDNMSLEAYLTKNTNAFVITGPLVPYNFNGYEATFNRNQPGTNLFMTRGLFIFRFVAAKANSNQEIGAIVSTFKFTQ